VKPHSKGETNNLPKVKLVTSDCGRSSRLARAHSAGERDKDVWQKKRGLSKYEFIDHIGKSTGRCVLKLESRGNRKKVEEERLMKADFNRLSKFGNHV
jgi:hypothetical protein